MAEMGGLRDGPGLCCAVDMGDHHADGPAVQRRQHVARGEFLQTHQCRQVQRTGNGQAGIHAAPVDRAVLGIKADEIQPRNGEGLDHLGHGRLDEGAGQGVPAQNAGAQAVGVHVSLL